MIRKLVKESLLEFHKGEDPISALGLGDIKTKMYKGLLGLIEKNKATTKFSEIKEESFDEDEICFSVNAITDYHDTTYRLTCDLNTNVFEVAGADSEGWAPWSESYEHESLEVALDEIQGWIDEALKSNEEYDDEEGFYDEQGFYHDY